MRTTMRASISRESDYRQSAPILYLCLFSCYTFFAFSGFGRIGNVLTVVFGLLLLGIDLRLSKTIVRIGQDGRQVVWFVLFFAYHVVTSLRGISDFRYWASSTIAYEFLIYLPIIFANSIRTNFGFDTKRKLLKILTYTMGMIALFSIIFYILNPGVAREAIVYQSDYDNLLIGGGYDLAFGSCILAVFVFSQFLNHGFTEKRQKRRAIICCAVCALHVYLTESTLTLIWLIVGFGLCFVFRSGKNTPKRKMLFVVFLIGLAGLFLLLRKPLGQFLMRIGNYSSDFLYSRRMYEMGTVLSGSTITRHTLERLSKIPMSWSLFKTSPIFGVGYKYGYKFSSLKAAGLGTHSAIFDTLAKYGIVGTFLWAGMMVSVIRYVQRTLKQSASNTWWIVLIAMMLWNPFMSVPSMLPVLLVIPLIAMIIRDERERRLDDEDQ